MNLIFDEEFKDFLTEMKDENRDSIEAVATISTGNDEVIGTMTVDAIVKFSEKSGLMKVKPARVSPVSQRRPSFSNSERHRRSFSCAELIEDLDRNIMAQSINVTMSMRFPFGWYTWDAFYIDIATIGVKEGLKRLSPCLSIIKMVHAVYALEKVIILGDGDYLLNSGGWKIRAVGTVFGIEL
ncbi:hypothetical protein NE237_004739 [Protea cynaroides]|uniref:Uncharacterized protein n=1 Tax=Protea cynaroides TaxID=273540 RepID=A0A9Q0QTV3_9MAGN|nr:hypothetical protein NE237_004739 [Protea cynaroides]